MDPEQLLNARVRRLELLLAVALFFALVPWVVIGAVAWKLSGPRLVLSKTLVTNGLEVRGLRGETLARLDDERQGGSLVLLSREGKTLATLGHGAGDGGALRLSSDEGEELSYLGVEPTGGGNLTLRDKKGEMLLVLRDNDGHGGGIAAMHGDNKLLGFLGGGVRGDGALQLWNSEGRTYASLATSQHGEALLQISRREGGEAIALAIDDALATQLVLRGPNGKAGSMLTCAERGGEISLYDAREQLRAFAGPMDGGGESFKVFNKEGDTLCVIGETGSGLGGFFRANSRGEKPAFCASADDREGAGIVSLHHPSGQQIFAAGMSGDGTGGIINVHDLDGKMILRTP